MEKGKENPSYKEWKLKVEIKFRQNMDHFKDGKNGSIAAIEQAKVDYIIGVTKGEVFEHLSSYLDALRAGMLVYASQVIGYLD